MKREGIERSSSIKKETRNELGTPALSHAPDFPEANRILCFAKNYDSARIPPSGGTQTMPIPYQIIRSDRKTMAIQLTMDGQVIVRCPRRKSQRDIQAFVERNRNWIETNIAKMPPADTVKLSPRELDTLRERARYLVDARVKFFAPKVGVTYNRVTIRAQRTRWGSCSAQGNLNFNCLLALVPPEVLDYVVVHELCHRKELNHSDRFWREVEKVIPDYKIRRKWLKEQGIKLVAKL